MYFKQLAFETVLAKFCGTKYIQSVVQLPNPNNLTLLQMKFSWSYTNFLLKTPGEHRSCFLL